MTSATLTWGCALLAFSPSLSLLLILTYAKAQLIIVVTTSAFAFLLSSLLSSLFWLAVPDSHRSNPFALIPPAVACQFILRCGFVHLYHRVEAVIRRSIRKHERHEAEIARRRREAEARDNGGGDPSALQNGAELPPQPSETAMLRLELNDWACGIAAGTGFGGMHAVLLYGTLLASESRQIGTLYQDSCPGVPSLVNSAATAFLFSVMDVFLMLLTFYGMRRRRDGASSSSSSSAEEGEGASSEYPSGGRSVSPSVLAGRLPLPRFSDGPRGGAAALMVVFAAHLGAGFATAPNLGEGGCRVALPSLAGVVVGTALLFWAGASGHYLPDNQNRRLGHGASSSLGGMHED